MDQKETLTCIVYSLSDFICVCSGVYLKLWEDIWISTNYKGKNETLGFAGF